MGNDNKQLNVNLTFMRDQLIGSGNILFAQKLLTILMRNIGINKEHYGTSWTNSNNGLHAH